jgi:hypothetical protein
MTGEDLKPTLIMLAGFWPSPAMTPEEVMAWSAELTGRLRITPEEASTVLRQFAESGTDDSKFRPRAGQIIPMVQALRRKRATEVSSRALIEAPIVQSDPVTFADGIAACRAAIAAGQQEQEQRRTQRLTKAKS